MMLLAFTPLYDPLPAIIPDMSNGWLWLVVPLLLAISIIYKGTRLDDLRKLPGQSFIMTFQILLVMGAAAVLLDGLYWFMTRVV
jgi:hypothetical protein